MSLTGVAFVTFAHFIHELVHLLWGVKGGRHANSAMGVSKGCLREPVLGRMEPVFGRMDQPPRHVLVTYATIAS